MKDLSFAAWLTARRNLHVEHWSDGWAIRRDTMDIPRKARYKTQEGAIRSACRQACKERGGIQVVVHDAMGRIIQRHQFGRLTSR